MRDQWGDKERGRERSIGLKKARFQRVQGQRDALGRETTRLVPMFGSQNVASRQIRPI